MSCRVLLGIPFCLSCAISSSVLGGAKRTGGEETIRGTEKIVDERVELLSGTEEVVDERVELVSGM